MKQSTKNQLVKVLDTKEMCQKHQYVINVVRRCQVKNTKSMLAWELRLFPIVSYIPNIEHIVEIVDQVKESIAINCYLGDDNYFVLI